MRTIRNILVAASLMLPLAAAAQSLSDVQAMSKEDRRAYIESMSEDERTAMRSKWRAEFDALPEEQKAAIREQRAGNRGGERRGREGQGGDREAMQSRWDSMSEEERAAMTERRRANKEKRRAEWDAMSEEERAAAREQRGGQKGQRKGGQHDDKEGSDQSQSGTDPQT
jgi:hypothetical protein